MEALIAQYDFFIAYFLFFIVFCVLYFVFCILYFVFGLLSMVLFIAYCLCTACEWSHSQVESAKACII